MLGKQQIDEDLLKKYLLGSLAEEERERLDELSIADDEIAWRLRAVENDLVDSYARGEMAGETLAQFKSAYLGSPARRQKAAVASAFASYEQHAGAASYPSPALFARAPVVRWAIAASIVGIVAAGYLLLAPETIHQQVPREIAVGTMTQTVTARSSAPVETLSFLLLPPTRGAGSLPTVAIPEGPHEVILRLQLESDDFPLYQAELRDLRSNQVVWRSGELTSGAEGPARSVAANMPAGTLREGQYSLELSGSPQSGGSEVIGSFPFRVVLK